MQYLPADPYPFKTEEPLPESRLLAILLPFLLASYKLPDPCCAPVASLMDYKQIH